jgi:hypothetical protein
MTDLFGKYLLGRQGAATIVSQHQNLSLPHPELEGEPPKQKNLPDIW